VRLPNFLVIGAAKAGTSAFFHFLTRHPDVFGCPVKEPNFLAFESEPVEFHGPGDEEVVRRTVTDPAAYRALFSGARDEAAVGEASAFYLYWPRAAEAISRLLPDARLIALLRDPVERAYSSYRHLVRDGHETLTFEAALEEEPARIAAGWQPLWHYRAAGRYCGQLERYLARVPRSRMLVLLYDDFVADPARVLARTYSFLGVDPGFEPDLARTLNPSGRPRLRSVQRLLQRESVLKRGVRRLIPQRRRSALWRHLQRWNTRPTSDAMAPRTRARLVEDFADEVVRLERLLDRDLSAWRSPP
jgi:hypothetical protein